MSDLANSYTLCQRIARRAARNFYYTFWLLPRSKRLAMCALYAFLRITDDLVDADELKTDVATRRRALHQWRHSLREAMSGRFSDPTLPALADTVARFQIPLEHLEAVIDGVELDLEPLEFQTWDDLAKYCHQVASVVGLACVHIWGFVDNRALPAAETTGLAFQLTNILRDLKEDAQRGRVYLPREDLARFQYTEDDLRNGLRDRRFRALMEFEIARAESLYQQGSQAMQWLSRDGQVAFSALSRTYREVLSEIKRRDGDVFTQRVSLSAWRKARIALSSFVRPLDAAPTAWEPAK